MARTATAYTLSTRRTEKEKRSPPASWVEIAEKVHVPEKYVPHFKAGKELRKRVDENIVAT